MALILNKPVRGSGGPPTDDHGPSPSKSGGATVKTGNPANHGRSRRPPRPGSSYSEFEYWASEGAMPLPEDVDLAIRMMMGEHDVADQEASPRPMR